MFPYSRSQQLSSFIMMSSFLKNSILSPPSQPFFLMEHHATGPVSKDPTLVITFALSRFSKNLLAIQPPTPPRVTVWGHLIDPGDPLGTLPTIFFWTPPFMRKPFSVPPPSLVNHTGFFRLFLSCSLHFQAFSPQRGPSLHHK